MEGLCFQIRLTRTPSPSRDSGGKGFFYWWRKINLFIYYLFISFDGMKQSFTYSGEAKTKREAMRHAKKIGIKNFSDLVETLLRNFINSRKETDPKLIRNAANEFVNKM
jgi:hypothetical protein